VKAKFHACWRGQPTYLGTYSANRCRPGHLRCPCACSNLPGRLYLRANSSSSIPFRYRYPKNIFTIFPLHLANAHHNRLDSLPAPSYPPSSVPERSRPTAWQLPITQPSHCRSNFTSQCASTPTPPPGPSTNLLSAFSQPSPPFAKPGGSLRGELGLFPHFGCMMPPPQARKKRYLFEWK
jgi:hypothetical protein